MVRRLLASLLIFSTCSTVLLVVGGAPPKKEAASAGPYAPKISPFSNEASFASKRIQVPRGFETSLFAAEPLLANPVCFCIDLKNRFYVAETFRLHDGVPDVRDHMDWLDDDLASRTVEDRVAMMKKHIGKDLPKWTVEHERIRLLEDTTGSGKADRSTVFADGFHHLADGIGAGLLARDGNVWYTCIPDFWLLRDPKGIGVASERRLLHHGYGVHVAFIGHDVHGLRFGPDGKIYFSSGDRGFHIQTEGRTVSCPDTGAVLRCNPDGSELEIIATGLRNPQELAFDQYGNLFTGDNNADHGDKARWVYIVEGGDSGWRGSYQYHRMPVALGPWNAEKLWHPAWDGQAAYIVPPIANVADGPAGLAYYPGLGLPERYRGHFFLCDFRGASGQSGIRSFAVKPRGASFEMVDQHQFIWSVLATDVDFGTDSCIYLTDWVEGWEKPTKGRIYKVCDPESLKHPEVARVKQLLAEGMSQRPLDELARLLEHIDMRVRQEAQFALAAKGLEAIPVFERVAHAKKTLARLHAIWGLGQIGRAHADAYKPLLGLLADHDAEVRAQAAKVLGNARIASAHDPLLHLAKDPEARVRFFATLAIGKLRRPEDVEAVLGMARENADRDPYLRHAGVMALTWIGDMDGLSRAGSDASPAVRMASLLALRRLEKPEVTRFLKDPEPRLVLEAARAIYDVPIPAALPELAALVTGKSLSEPLWYRIAAAHFRLGQAENAAAVTTLAARADVPADVRVEALRALGDWARPSGRDRILGQWRPLEPRPRHLAADALKPQLETVFRGPDNVRLEAAKVAATLQLKESGPLLVALLSDKERSADVRVQALKSLEALKDPRLEEAMTFALKDESFKVRLEGRRVLARQKPEEAADILETVLTHGGVDDQQGVLAILGDLKSPRADEVLSRWLDKLQARQVPLEIQLDLLEASAKRKSVEVKRKLAAYEASRPKNDLLARYREALAGGDAEAGKHIFYHKDEVSCLRCHKINGEGGEVGPDLTGIGSRQKREYLLESIVDPNKEIAKGFETVVLGLSNGQFTSGIIKSEDGKEIHLINADGKLLTVPRNQVEERLRGKSAMPDNAMKHLSKSDLRNLVEFLAGLRDKK